MHPSPTPPTSLRTARSTPSQRGRWLLGGGVLLLLIALYAAGLFHRGYESKSIAFSGITRVQSGHGFGARTMYLRQGQSLVVRYEADIRHGDLRVWLNKRFEPLTDVPDGSATVTSSGTGQLPVPIRESALYHLTIRGTPDRNGYDISYTLSWRVE
jgi:hypothetical protein